MPTAFLLRMPRLPGCDAVSLDEGLLTFRRRVVPSSSRVKEVKVLQSSETSVISLSSTQSHM
jgi:hypothetical protein